MTRLTPQQVRDRALLEADWQHQLTDAAEALGWSWVHFRPARTARGWVTPVEGPLGAGWPDLVLIGHGRVVLVEVKRELAKTSPGQDWVQDLLRENGCEVYTWRPSDLEDAVRILRG